MCLAKMALKFKKEKLMNSEKTNQTIQPANNQFSAFVIGGTGGVGAHLVQKLLDSPRYAQVTVISRREIAPAPKLNIVIWDDFTDALLDHPEKAIAAFQGHDVGFCCLGASEQALMGLLVNPKKYKPVFRTIDYDYVIGAASAAHRAGVSHFSVISSISASPDAKFYLLRIKGEMERDVQVLDFTGISIFRPSHLVKAATGVESPLKQVGKNMMALLARLIPSKETKLRVEDVAAAMKAEFEQRMTHQTGNVMFYQPQAIAALAITDPEIASK